MTENIDAYGHNEDDNSGDDDKSNYNAMMMMMIMMMVISDHDVLVADIKVYLRLYKSIYYKPYR